MKAGGGQHQVGEAEPAMAGGRAGLDCVSQPEKAEATGLCLHPEPQACVGNFFCSLLSKAACFQDELSGQPGHSDLLLPLLPQTILSGLICCLILGPAWGL